MEKIGDIIQNHDHSQPNIRFKHTTNVLGRKKTKNKTTSRHSNEGKTKLFQTDLYNQK